MEEILRESHNLPGPRVTLREKENGQTVMYLHVKQGTKPSIDKKGGDFMLNLIIRMAHNLNIDLYKAYCSNFGNDAHLYKL